MKLILFTVSIFVFGCSATSLTSVEDQLQRMHLEMEQLKRSNEESIAVIGALKQTYNEKIRTCESSQFGAAAEIGKNRSGPESFYIFLCEFFPFFPREPITSKYRQTLRPS